MSAGEEGPKEGQGLPPVTPDGKTSVVLYRVPDSLTQRVVLRTRVQNGAPQHPSQIATAPEQGVGAEAAALTHISHVPLKRGLGATVLNLTSRLFKAFVRGFPVSQAELNEVFPPTESRFQVERFLAEGAFGAVYEGMDLKYGRAIAFKAIKTPPGEAPDLERFKSETRIHGRLIHPAIVTLLEAEPLTDALRKARPGHAAITPGHFFAVQELVAGGRNLTKLIKEMVAAPLSLDERLRIFLEICDALHYAHNKGVVHRDLKPDNILITNDLHPKVADWGLGVLMNKDRCVPNGSGAGSPAYMAPEQIFLGLAVAARTDLYALAVILYQLLVGGYYLPMKEADGQEELFRLILNAVPLPLYSPERPEISKDLENIVFRALEKDPKKRWQSVREMADTIRSLVARQRQEGQRQEAIAHEKKEHTRQLLRNARATRVKSKERVKEIGLLKEEVTRLRKETPSWAPLLQKRPLKAAERELKAAEQEVGNLKQEYLALLGQVLEYQPQHVEAHACLAAVAKDDHIAAQRGEEVSSQESPVARAERLFRKHGQPAVVAAYFDQEGVLEFDTNPTGAEAILFKYVEDEDGKLRPMFVCKLGPTPVRAQLPMGSCLVVLKKSGYRPVRYPVFLTRAYDELNSWHGGIVPLFTEAQIGKGRVYIPPTKFLTGGDPELSRGSSKRAEVKQTPGFLIAQYPTTVGEYEAFLADVGREAHTPQSTPWKKPGHPVVGVTWENAIAYCAWRTQGDGGTPCRLPTEWEVEVAGGGVDGRRYSWGWCAEAYFATASDHYKPGEAKLVEVHECAPQDQSPYGAYGFAGLVSVLTITEYPNGVGIRCGRWGMEIKEGTVRMRGALQKGVATPQHGFRVAWDLPTTT